MPGIPMPGGAPTVRVCVTAQHREMLDQVLRLFDITPDYDLGVMESNQTPTQVASAVLARLEPILATERPEGVEAGTARIIGTARGRIVAEAIRLLDDPAAYAAMATAVNPYGDGKASGRIVRALLEHGPSTRTT